MKRFVVRTKVTNDDNKNTDSHRECAKERSETQGIQSSEPGQGLENQTTDHNPNKPIRLEYTVIGDTAPSDK